MNLTAYGVLALRAAGARRAASPGAARWLRAAQNEDGGWGFGPSQSSDPDSTGAAMQGVAASGAGGLDVRRSPICAGPSAARAAGA